MDVEAFIPSPVLLCIINKFGRATHKNSDSRFPFEMAADIKKEPQREDMNNARRILALGDSLTEGYYRFGTQFHPYTDRLHKLLEPKGIFEIHNAGVSGETTDRMLERLRGLLKPKSSPWYDLVVILGGTNDLGFRSAEDIFKNIQLMSDLVQTQKSGDRHSRVVIMTVPHCRKSPQWILDKRSSVNSQIKTYASQKEIPIVDLEYWGKLNPMGKSEEEIDEIWDTDGLHFTPAGSDVIADALFRTLSTENVV
ncbi:hypothetical protein PROFUN_00781 [Planoprotostelium fungivorum]|uniref:SGNH hydrolase-type esterase domain-containing protein n=1 Tax=Planoprotostelium fungivorum TaxID=1890364 RepID=A0A2P6P002_9EUKA|nr:hypothetical protein PROFUN_00781 [Planoprotostelium fungivorum]